MKAKVLVFLVVGIGSGFLAIAFKKRVHRYLVSQRLLKSVTFADDPDEGIALFV